MVSYDVVSLFTNVPLEETIQIIANRIYSDTSPPLDKKGRLYKITQTRHGRNISV